MKDRLEIVDARIELTQGANKTKIGISDVLSRYGTQAMIALDRGDVVWIIAERSDDWKDERIGG